NRNDLILTARHCLDCWYYLATVASQPSYGGIEPGDPDFTNNPQPVIRVQVEFGAEYMPDCQCGGALPPVGCNDGLCDSPDETNQCQAALIPDCTAADVWQVRRWGFAVGGVTDATKACDWIVLKALPNGLGQLPGQIYPRLPIGRYVASTQY